MKTKIVLYGGEQDGWEQEIDPADRPDVFYVVPYADQAKIDGVKSQRAKQELHAKLATLAYKFDRSKSSPTRFRMYRRPELDRVTQP